MEQTGNNGDAATSLPTEKHGKAVADTNQAVQSTYMYSAQVHKWTAIEHSRA